MNKYQKNKQAINKKNQEEMIRSLVEKEVKKRLQEIQKESTEEENPEKWSSNQKATFGFTILNFLISLARLILSFF